MGETYHSGGSNTMDALMESNQMLVAGGLVCIAGGAAIINKVLTMTNGSNKSLALPLVAPKFVNATHVTPGQRVGVSRAGGKDDVAVGDDKFDVTQMPGVLPPVGFWDPLKLSNGKTERRMRWFRECEIKHGRVSMLAALGFIVQESFHPLFGGNIDVPAAFAFQQTPLENFWPAVVTAIAIPEIFSVFQFQDPSSGEQWAMKEDHEPGNLGFDPLGLKPTDPKAFKEMQTKELNNGRLAMIAAAGMIAQEVATDSKLFGN